MLFRSDDGNPCTVDTCKNGAPVNSAGIGCVAVVSGTDGKPCTDGNACTVGDSCQNGECNPGQNGCGCTKDADCAGKNGGNLCLGVFYCDKSVANQWQCKPNPNTVANCDTSLNNACQTNACDPATGQCVLTKKPDGLACDADNTKCTASDSCSNGKCVAGKVLDCDDKNPCTDDSCDAVGGCVNKANTAPCDADGNYCTQNDACDPTTKSCTAGKAKVCDDGEACTKDSCDAGTAKCVFTNLVQSCDDGNKCTTGDACGAVGEKWTCVPGKAGLCDDGNPCTDDTCDAQKGCTNVINTKNTVACYTGPAKTQDIGICKSGKKACNADGSYGVCTGDVTPGPSELCNGLDDNCNGQADEGCKAAVFTAEFGSATLQASGAKYATRTTLSGGVGGTSDGDKHTSVFGIWPYLKQLLGW